MACIYVCDGCGKQVPADRSGHDYFKPRLWFQRSDAEGIQTACSRECIEKVAKETGKTPLVAPF